MAPNAYFDWLPSPYRTYWLARWLSARFHAGGAWFDSLTCDVPLAWLPRIYSYSRLSHSALSMKKILVLHKRAPHLHHSPSLSSVGVPVASSILRAVASTATAGTPPPTQLHTRLSAAAQTLPAIRRTMRARGVETMTPYLLYCIPLPLLHFVTSLHDLPHDILALHTAYTAPSPAVHHCCRNTFCIALSTCDNSEDACWHRLQHRCLAGIEQPARTRQACAGSRRCAFQFPGLAGRCPAAPAVRVYLFRVCCCLILGLHAF